MQIFVCYTALLLLQEFIFGHGEVITSVSDLQKLHETECFCIEIMVKFVKAREENTDFIKSYWNNCKTHHNEASGDVEKHISNPINGLRLEKRLTADLNQVQNLMAFNNIKEHVINLTLLNNTKPMALPTDKNLSDTTEVIIRLQKPYRLNTRDPVQGNLPGVKNCTPLSALYCFQSGAHANNKKQYHYSTLWLYQIIETVKIENDTVDVLQYLILAQHCSGNQTAAFKLMKQRMNCNPEQHIVHLMEWNNKDYEEELKKPMKEIRKTIVFEGYSSRCWGKISTPLVVEKISQLHCPFQDYGSLVLQLAPFKVEEVYRNPDVCMVYDLFSDQEIETIEHFAQRVVSYVKSKL